MIWRLSACLLLAWASSACGRGGPAGGFTALESLLLARDAAHSTGVAAIRLDPPSQAKVPLDRPPSARFGEEFAILRGSHESKEQVLAESLPTACEHGVLRWRVRPDRVDHSQSAALRLEPVGVDAGAGTMLAITLGRGGGSGKRTFRLQAAGRWLDAESPQAAILEGVEIEATLLWNLRERFVALSVTDALHRTLLDARLPLGSPPDAAIAALSLTLDGVGSRSGPEPRLDLALRPIEFWDLGRP